MKVSSSSFALVQKRLGSYGQTVSWKFGAGQGTGTVGEIKTQGQLEIQSNGKSVKRNADPSNPAVHVEREGNDVVKRMSELTKVDMETEQDNPASMEEGEGGEEKPAETGEKDATAATEAVAPKKRSHTKKASAAAETGEKREHEEEEEVATGETGDGEAGGGEHPAADKKKRARGAKAEGGAKKTRAATKTGAEGKKPGRPRKGSKAKKHEEGAGEGEAMEVETKKRGPGRPRKSDASEHPPTAEETTEDAPAARTRSKD